MIPAPLVHSAPSARRGPCLLFGLLPLGLLPLGLLLARTAPAQAGPAEQRLFREANAAYTAGRYADARKRYEQILQQGMDNERLLYNLGNAYFRLGQLGRAIWAYERALKLAPELGEARHNLELAREMAARKVKDKVVGARQPPFRERLVRYFSVTGATAWFYALWWVAFGLLIVVLLLGRGVLRSVLLVLTVVAALTVGLFGWIYHERVELAEHTREAIVLEQTVPVREGPRGIATKAFEIHAGLKVRLDAREDKWWKIRLPNGLEGWVRADKLGEL
jgi:tetratricopeptide (TPR) repeat protein